MLKIATCAMIISFSAASGVYAEVTNEDGSITGVSGYRWKDFTVRDVSPITPSGNVSPTCERLDKRIKSRGGEGCELIAVNPKNGSEGVCRCTW